jgi:hypothetical protein
MHEQRPELSLARPWVAALLAGLAASALALLVPALGRNIPQADPSQDYLRGVLWAILIGISILAWPVPNRDRALLQGLWFLKALCALGPMLFYEAFYQQLDAFAYFNAVKRPVIAPFDFQFGFGTTNVIAITRALSVLVGPWFHALKIAFAAIGLVAIYLFYRAIVMALGQERPALLIIIALVPSVFFWSSTLGKEPLILLGLGLHAFGAVAWATSRKPGMLALAFAGVAACALVRIWMVIILLLPLLWLILRAQRSLLMRVLIVVPCLFGLALALAQLRTMFQLEALTDVLTTAGNISQSWAYGGSGQQMAELTSVKSALLFLPLGTFTALFRPLPGEVMHPFGVLAGLENLALLGLSAVTLLKAKRRALHSPLVQWALALVLLWGIVYGFVSYQNLGAAVRFKLQVLPFLVLWFILMRTARRTAEAPWPA